MISIPSRKLISALIIVITLFYEDAKAQKLDHYGGFTAMLGDSTGKWHIQEISGRYWFVTPAGHVMYLLGVNHFYSSSEADKQQVIKNLEKWQFNSCGYGAPDWLLQKVPGFVHVSLHDAVHWMPAHRFKFIDVFSKDYEHWLEANIRDQCSSAKGNDNVIGYSLTDTPRYNIDTLRRRRGDDWVSFMRRLPEGSAGKQRYVAFLKERYDYNIEKFRKAYRLSHINSFEELDSYDFANIELARPAIRQDDEAFLVIVVDRMYGLARHFFNQYDEGALVSSEKFKMHDHPAPILELAGKYFDFISVQAGPTQGPDVGQGADERVFEKDYWSGLYELSGKPLFLTDHGFSFYTPEHPRTLWHQFTSEVRAADFYQEYLQQVTALPFILGYVKCQYRDNFDPLRNLLKQGLVGSDGKPHPVLEEKIIKANTSVLNQLYNQN